MVKCKGKTQSGKNCKRTCLDSEFCWQHTPTPAKTVLWDSRGFPLPSHKIGLKIRKKIERRITSGPKKDDSFGYIYIYTLPKDKGLSYFKIGQTKGNPIKRIRDWDKTAVCIKHFLVSKRNFCERLIHHYLDHRRMSRYGDYAVWKATGKSVIPNVKPPVKLEGSNKQIEWFCCEKEELLALVKKVVKRANKLFL